MGEAVQGQLEWRKQGKVAQVRKSRLFHGFSFLYFSEGVNDCPCLQFSVSCIDSCFLCVFSTYLRVLVSFFHVGQLSDRAVSGHPWLLEHNYDGDVSY